MSRNTISTIKWSSLQTYTSGEMAFSLGWERALVLVSNRNYRSRTKGHAKQPGLKGVRAKKIIMAQPLNWAL